MLKVIDVYYPGIDRPQKKAVEEVPQIGDDFDGHVVDWVRHETPTSEVKATIILVRGNVKC